MHIYIGADHRGFAQKEELKTWLSASDYSVIDCGNTMLDPNDDFPDFAFAVADAVVRDPEGRGIVICGSGAGVAIAANKVGGVRCALGFIPEEIAHARTDDDINVLALSAEYVTLEKAKEVITSFLATPYAPEPRHVRRLAKITARE